jgi:hypothetical protein
MEILVLLYHYLFNVKIFICEFVFFYGFLYDLDAPEIDRNDPNRNRVATDSDRLLTAEFHCYLSAIPKPTITWLKVSLTNFFFLFQ